MNQKKSNTHKLLIGIGCFACLCIGFFTGKFLQLDFLQFEDKVEFEDTIQIVLSIISIAVTIWLALHISNVLDRNKEVSKTKKEFYYDHIKYIEGILFDLSEDITACQESGGTINYYKATNVIKRLNASNKNLKDKLGSILGNDSFEKFTESAHSINITLTSTPPNENEGGQFVSITNNKITIPNNLISTLQKDISLLTSNVFELKFAINDKL